MASFNRVLLMGNLTRDPQLRYLPNNTAVCDFGMAINRKWRDKDGNQKDDVCYVDLTAFAKTGEIINQYMSKGKPIFIEGRLRFESWTGQDGQKRNRLSVVVDNFQFVGSPRDGGGGGGGPPPMEGRGDAGAQRGGYQPQSGGSAVGGPPEHMPVDELPPPSDDIPF